MCPWICKMGVFSCYGFWINIIQFQQFINQILKKPVFFSSWYYFELYNETLPHNSEIGLRNLPGTFLQYQTIIPMCKKSLCTRFLTPSIFNSKIGFADQWADWAMISNRPGNNMNREAAHLTLLHDWIQFSFLRLIWFCCEQPSFLTSTKFCW